MADQRQGIGDDITSGMALYITCIFLGLGELQQLGHDLADAVDLLVEQAELGPQGIDILA